MKNAKKAIFAGVLTAMMLTSTATTLVTSADNCVTGPEESAAKTNSTVRLSRLKDCTLVYPEYARVCDEPYVAELNKDRTVKGKLELRDGETLYIPAGKTLTLNKSSVLYGGTIYVENGATLIIKDRLTVYDSASLICDGRINVGRNGVIQLYSGGMLYGSPDSTIKLNANSYLYSDDYATNVCLGEVIKINGLNADIRRTFFPSVVSAVRTTTDLVSNTLSSEVVSADDVKKSLSAKWYTLQEVPAGGISEMLTVLFDNGSTMKFSYVGDRILGIKGTSVRNIWEYTADRLDAFYDEDSASDSSSDKKFTASQLDELTCLSTNVVTAKLDSVSGNSGASEFKFTVTEQLKGEADKKICVMRDQKWKGASDKDFVVGQEYLLFLNSVDLVYKDLYYTLEYSVSAPISSGKLISVRYKGGEYSLADEIATLKNVRARIKDIADMDYSQSVDGGYIHNTDINNVVKLSPYIVKVKITDNIEKFGESDDVSIFTAELEKSYKLTPSDPLKIILPNDKVKVGNEYVIILYPYNGTSQKIYMESSKNSIFRPDDAELKAAMDKSYL